MHLENGASRPFKLRKSPAARMREAAEIRRKYPNRIPVIVERFQREKALPPLERSKFLVSHELPLAQLALTLRTRLCLDSSQTFFLLVENRGIPNMATTMRELDLENRDEDGFLYLTYASQEMFGAPSPEPPESPHSRSFPGEIRDESPQIRG